MTPHILEWSYGKCNLNEILFKLYGCKLGIGLLRDLKDHTDLAVVGPMCMPGTSILSLSGTVLVTCFSFGHHGQNLWRERPQLGGRPVEIRNEVGVGRISDIRSE